MHFMSVKKSRNVLVLYFIHILACEQTLWDALTSGREKELATQSLEFEYLHRKSQCEVLIGGDDISNDVMTIGTCFLCLFTFALVSFEPIGGEPQGKWRWNLNSRDVVASCPSFSRPAAKVPRRACS